MLKYSVDAGKTWRVVTFSTGAYEITTLNAYLQEALKTDSNENKIEVRANVVEYAVVLMLDPNAWIDLTIDGAIASVLGFEKKLYKVTTSSQLPPNLRRVRSIFITTNLAAQNYAPWGFARMIENIPIAVSPGYDIIHTPSVAKYFETPREVVYNVMVGLVDNERSPIDFRSEICHIALLVNKKDD